MMAHYPGFWAGLLVLALFALMAGMIINGVLRLVASMGL